MKKMAEIRGHSPIYPIQNENRFEQVPTKGKILTYTATNIAIVDTENGTKSEWSSLQNSIG